MYNSRMIQDNSPQYATLMRTPPIVVTISGLPGLPQHRQSGRGGEEEDEGTEGKLRKKKHKSKKRTVIDPEE